MDKVFLSTVTFNRLKYLKHHIFCLINQDFKYFDWVIVDNGSTDGTVEYLKALKLVLGDKIRVFLFGENIGHAKAYNFALLRRRPEQHWIQIEQDISVEYYHPEENQWIAELGWEIDRWDDVGLIGVKQDIEEKWIADWDRQIEIVPTFRIPGQCIVVKNEVINELGFYEEDYNLWGHTDLLLVKRVQKLGYITAFYKSHFSEFDGECGLMDAIHLERIIPCVQYANYVINKRSDADKYMQKFVQEMADINTGVKDLYVDTIMRDYTNYVEL